MDYEELEKEIQKIVEMVEKLPEPYREKTFETLLSNILIKPTTQEVNEETSEAESYDFQIPIEVRAFLRQFSIDEGRIYELFLITGKDEIVSTYKISTTSFSKAQIQISIMTALENTLKQTGKFEFDIEDVRKRCQDNKCYNMKNFMAHFSNNKKLFKDLKNEQHIILSPYGKEKLAEIINELQK